MKNNVKNVPVILQMEALECGAASLAMILAYYKKYIPLEQLRSDCNVSRDGSTAKYINRAAKHHGLEAKGFRMNVEKLKEQTEFPMIIHWNFNHFLVLCGFKNGKAIINDPAGGRIKVDMEEFERSYTGIALKFKPSESFKPSGKPVSTMAFVKKRLKGSGSSLTFILTMGLIMCAAALVKPVFYKIFTDDILIGGDGEKMRPLLLAMLAALGVSFLCESLRSYYLAKLQAKMSISSSSSFMWHVLRLPVDFFSQRFAGDIAARQQSNNEIAIALCSQLAPVILNVVMIGVYMAVMIFYSVPLALIGIAMALINIVLMRSVSKQNTNAAKSVQRDSGKLSGIMIAAVSMIETIKASGSENGYFEKWSGYQASVNTQNVRFTKIQYYLGMVPSLVAEVLNVTVTVLGVWLVIRGEFTPGMIFAFQGFLASFMSPAVSLISSGQQMQEMRTNMERIEDVMEYPDDEVMDNDTEDVDEERSYTKLSGNLSMRHVSFGYSRLEPPLIRDFNLELKKGQSVAFVGASGCGKSTLSKLISNLYQPWAGEVLFDGKSASQIDRSVFTGSVSVVDQDIILFEDPISDNIKMWDNSIEDFEMILAARDAQIHETIMQREDAYKHKMIEDGKDFSGGERQRLEIARVLALDPTIIVMDEATSALDARTEYEVVHAIRERGITCIVIAHRLSTIRDCDEIIVLDHGDVVERGTHDQLMALDGRYKQLVSNE